MDKLADIGIAFKHFGPGAHKDGSPQSIHGRHAVHVGGRKVNVFVEPDTSDSQVRGGWNVYGGFVGGTRTRGKGKGGERTTQHFGNIGQRTIALRDDRGKEKGERFGWWATPSRHPILSPVHHPIQGTVNTAERALQKLVERHLETVGNVANARRLPKMSWRTLRRKNAAQQTYQQRKAK